jgi:hypothetical protein
MLEFLLVVFVWAAGWAATKAKLGGSRPVSCSDRRRKGAGN